jgi:hypothetical protein
MKIHLSLVLLALTATPALAAGYLTPAELAQETGLTQRQVGMVLGPRTAYPEYLSAYSFARDKFIRAVGKQRYEDLVRHYRMQRQPNQLMASSDGGRAPGS